ncbi:MAG: hypothetical protein ABSG89_03780 [Bacteroidales bacterium]|jgi:hypothetical protein
MKKSVIIILLVIFVIPGLNLRTFAEKARKYQTADPVNPGDTKIPSAGEKKSISDNLANANGIKTRCNEAGLSGSSEDKPLKAEPEISGIFDLFTCDNDDGTRGRHFNGSRHFKGHWAGIELGFNNYVTNNNSSSMPSSIDYMSLNSGKSVNFNLNFAQLSIGLMRHAGIVTGLGLNWDNYRFDGNNSIMKDASGMIVDDPQTGTLKKSKLATLYLIVPVLLEVQIPTDRQRINLAAGPIGAIKLSSHTKMVYQDNDVVKSDGDFNLNMLRYGFTARVGYENFMIYGTYYKTPLFISGEGPGGIDLFPYEIGIALVIH